jgi:hypothetical protein
MVTERRGAEVKVFISSVRVALEAERDVLPGLILALGHDAARFEDFGAQSMPSREACLRGVNVSDAYLLLLGPKYGHIFTETGQSATHDEWNAAVAKGMPRLVFRKINVEFEPQQEAFAALVGDYAQGAFYAEFTDVAELQTKVVQALRSLEAQPSTLSYSALRSPVAVRWLDDGNAQGRGTSMPPLLELHIVPLDAELLSARQLRELPHQLLASLRSTGALPLAAGAEPVLERDAVIIELPRPQSRWDEPRDEALAGVRVAASGQVSLWWSLPRDTLGSILDAEVLTATIARGLRLVGALHVLPNGDVAIGIGLGGSTSMISEGKVTGIARRSASMSHSREQSVRVAPDEAVSAAAFDRGADEVARSLVMSLLESFRARG